MYAYILLWGIMVGKTLYHHIVYLQLCYYSVYPLDSYCLKLYLNNFHLSAAILFIISSLIYSSIKSDQTPKSVEHTICI